MNKSLILIAVVVPCRLLAQQFPSYEVAPLLNQPSNKVINFVQEREYFYKSKNKATDASVTYTYKSLASDRTVMFAIKNNRLTSFMGNEKGYNFYNIVKSLLASNYTLRTDKSRGEYLYDAPKLVPGSVYDFENQEAHVQCVVICPVNLSSSYDYISVHYSILK